MISESNKILQAELSCTFTLLSCLPVDEYALAMEAASKKVTDKISEDSITEPVNGAKSTDSQPTIDTLVDMPSESIPTLESQTPLQMPIDFDKPDDEKAPSDDDDYNLFSANFPSSSAVGRGTVTPANRRGKRPANRGGGGGVPPKTRKQPAQTQPFSP